MNISNISGNNLDYMVQNLNRQKVMTQAIETPSESSGPQFTDFLKQGLETLNKEQLIAEKHGQDIASGEVKDLQKAIIEIDRANLSITLAGEVKNKLLSAYKEIMNIQV